MTVQTPESAQIVQLVDPSGIGLGNAPKLEAHQGRGLLHRAVSVLIFRADGGLILQKRAPAKYHFASRWANSCCTHPLVDETPMEAAVRALGTELGLACDLEEQFSFVYEARDDLSGLVEREFDHVFVGVSKENPLLDPEHVSEWRPVQPAELALAMTHSPEDYSPWLKEILREAANQSVPSALLRDFAARWLAY